MSFLDYLSRLGEFKSIDVFKQAKGRNFKGFYIMLIRVDTKRMS